MLHEKLIFIIGSPRSGSTMLQRMLGSHSEIFTHPEPHLLTPLAYLGYYDTVEKAPYDYVNSGEALREFVQELPNGEQDYLDALRSYSSTVYERALQPTGKSHFLDKTPAYGLVLPFITKLYPRAKYVVLTRHPMAIMHSQAHSFFGGDYQAAYETNPIVQQYVPAIAEMMLEKTVDYVHVRYEDVVTEPEREMRKVLKHLELEFEEGVVEYGRQKHITKSFGDPMTVEKHSRPVAKSVNKWAADLAANPEALALAERIVESLAADDIAAWGYDKAELLAPVEGAGVLKTKTALFNTYRMKRQVLLAARKTIQGNSMGAAVKKVRYFCDLILRT